MIKAKISSNRAYLHAMCKTWQVNMGTCLFNLVDGNMHNE